MTKENKLALLEEMFDLDEGTLNENIVLEDLDEWDSMSKLSLIVLMDDECGKELSGDQIKAFKTIGDILDYMD